MEPALALHWEAITPTTWRFVLRPEVRFSNGEPCDAAAVVATIAHLMRPESAAMAVAAETKTLTAVRAIERLTIEFDTRAPDPILPARLSLIQIVPPQAWAKMGPEQFAQTPIGTGAYLLGDWGTKTGRTVLLANPTSWRKPKQIDRVALAVLADPVARAQALISGQVEITQNIGHEDIALLRRRGFIVDVLAAPAVMTLAIRNMPPATLALQDVRVRRALNYAVNKSDIADTILHGTTKPSGQGAIPGVFGYDPDIAPFPFDPGKAKALLAEAGFAKGLRLSAAVLLGNVPGDAAIYQKVAQDLAAVGVALDIKVVSGPEWSRLYTTGAWRDLDMVAMGWSSGSYYDSIRALEQFGCLRPGAFFCAPELNDLLTQAKTNMDTALREAQQRTLMRELHDLAPGILLVGGATIVARSPRLAKLISTGSGYRFEEMELAP